MKRKYTENDTEVSIPFKRVKREALGKGKWANQLYRISALILPSLYLMLGIKSVEELVHDAISKDDVTLFQYAVDLNIRVAPSLVREIVLLNRIEMMQYLISQGIDLDKAKEQGEKTPFYLAMNHTDLTMARLLAQEGRVNVNRKIGWRKFTFLHLAVFHGRGENIISFLVKDCGINVNEKDSLGKTALHYANACMKKQLIELGADVNIADTWGLTPLLTAYNYEEKKILIEAGADVNVAGVFGTTPLHKAKTDQEIELLIEAGADFSAKCNANLFVFSDDKLQSMVVRPLLINQYHNLLSLQSLAASCISSRVKKEDLPKLGLPKPLIDYCRVTPTLERCKNMLRFCRQKLR